MSSSVSIFDKNIESIFSKLFRIRKQHSNFINTKSASGIANIVDTKREVILTKRQVAGGYIYKEELEIKGSNEKKYNDKIDIYVY